MHWNTRREQGQQQAAANKSGKVFHGWNVPLWLVVIFVRSVLTEQEPAASRSDFNRLPSRRG